MTDHGKLPAFQFYPGDWRKDIGIQSLDFFDRGVWLEVLCLMHESEDRGRLVLNGRTMPNSAIARVLGLPVEKWTEVRDRLVGFGVASEDENGAIVNRRMVRDEHIRRVRAEAGRRGGASGGRPKPETSKNPANPKQTPKQNGSKPDGENAAEECGDPRDSDSEPASKTEANGEQNKPPSVSSSSSTSTSVDKPPPCVGGLRTALDELCEGFSEVEKSAAEALAHDQHNPERWTKGVIALWLGQGDSEPTERTISGLDRPSRLRALALGLTRYHAEGAAWSSRFFRGFMTTAIGEINGLRGSTAAHRPAKSRVRPTESGIGSNQGQHLIEGDAA